MTTKESGGSTTSPWTLRRHTACGSDVVIGSGNCVIAKNYRQTVGYPTPNFRQLVKEGKLLPYTTFTQYESVGSASGSYDVRQVGYPGTCGKLRDYGVPYQTYGINSRTVTDLAFECGKLDAFQFVQAAAARIYNKGWDALTFAGELKQTLRMFSGIGKKMQRTIDRIDAKSSTKKLSALKRYDHLEDLWLEGRYGWRTLQYDLEDLSNALQEFDETRSRYVERAGGSISWQTQTVTVDSTGWLSGIITYTTERNYSLSARGSVAADITPPRFGINPVTTAWELTKLSFVIDWFYDVGTALDSIGLLTLATNVTAAKGFDIRCETTYRVTAVAKAGYVITSLDIRSDCSDHAVFRVPTSVPISPFIKANLNVYKAIDIAALVRQAFRRR